MAGAIAASRWLAATLYGVTTREPAVYVTAVLILGFVSLVASYAPARRASRADPMEALRVD
jgi:ABC-type lipoprotein release transport system permease subunit